MAFTAGNSTTATAMSARKRRATPAKKTANRVGGTGTPTTDRQGLPLGPTGRTIVTLRPGPQRETIRALRSTAGVAMASTADFEDAAPSDDALASGAILLHNLDVAILPGDGDQVRSLEAAVNDAANPILSVEPEMFVIPFADGSEVTEESAEGALLTAGGLEYLRGYGDAIEGLISRLLHGGASSVDDEATLLTTFVDTATHTWGLQATAADASQCTGSGIRVAVLDTGFDLNHPDFAGRAIISQSFVPGQAVQDGHSHGTHCVGTSCGPRVPPGGTRRYGVAGQATILVGKVLSNSGSGQQGWILAGINWAIQNNAAVISMSLGSPVQVGGTFSPAYEQAALAALNRNCLIVAAAGNSGTDPQFFPVGSPANCPSVLAVAAVDNNLQRAGFSCRGVNPNGGNVDIAGPGVGTFSSVPMPTRYGLKSGTSMATPHVAGIAALWAQSSGARGMALWQRLTSSAKNIGQTVDQVGAGLVQAPSCRRVVGPLRPPVRPPIVFPPRIPFPPVRLPVPPRPPMIPGSLGDAAPDLGPIVPGGPSHALTDTDG